MRTLVLAALLAVSTAVAAPAPAGSYRPLASASRDPAWQHAVAAWDAAAAERSARAAVPRWEAAAAAFDAIATADAALAGAVAWAAAVRGTPQALRTGDGEGSAERSTRTSSTRSTMSRGSSRSRAPPPTMRAR